MSSWLILTTLMDDEVAVRDGRNGVERIAMRQHDFFLLQVTDPVEGAVVRGSVAEVPAPVGPPVVLGRHVGVYGLAVPHDPRVPGRLPDRLSGDSRRDVITQPHIDLRVRQQGFHIW